LKAIPCEVLACHQHPHIISLAICEYAAQGGEFQCATMPGKPSDDVAPGTLSSILKQSDLKK